MKKSDNDTAKNESTSEVMLGTPLIMKNGHLTKLLKPVKKKFAPE